MKIRWTLSLAAVALVVGAFPAFAHQGQLPPPKSVDRQKLDKKIDAISKTPFVTPHQGESLKKVLDGGERMKQDEKISQPDPFTPGPQNTAPGAPPAPGQAPGAAPTEGQAPQAEEAKPEPQKPEYRLMGTVCSKGKPDLAVFNTGGEWPSMLKAGDKLDDFTVVISVGRGKVCLEKIVSQAQPAVEPQLAPDGKQIPGRPASPEKKERFDLYAW